jgi:hypothetical protein
MLPRTETIDANGQGLKVNDVELVQAKCVKEECKAWGIVARGINSGSFAGKPTMKEISGCKLIPADK